MRAAPYYKGRRYEYRLMRVLEEAGFLVVRVPVSGGGRRGGSLPDLICVKGGRAVGIEVKMRGDGRHIHIPRERFEALKALKDKHGMDVFICVYYTELGGYRCLELGRYSYTTREYVVYTRGAFYTEGTPPSKL